MCVCVCVCIYIYLTICISACLSICTPTEQVGYYSIVCLFVCLFVVFSNQEANKPENRVKRPWIITMGHRPMYCTNKVDDLCTNHENEARKLTSV